MSPCFHLLLHLAAEVDRTLHHCHGDPGEPHHSSGCPVPLLQDEEVSLVPSLQCHGPPYPSFFSPRSQHDLTQSLSINPTSTHSSLSVQGRKRRFISVAGNRSCLGAEETTVGNGTGNFVRVGAHERPASASWGSGGERWRGEGRLYLHCEPSVAM